MARLGAVLLLAWVMIFATAHGQDLAAPAEPFAELVLQLPAVPVADAVIEGTVVEIVRLPDGKPVPAGYGLAVDCPGGGTVPAYALITRGIVIRLQSAVVDRPTRLSKGQVDLSVAATGTSVVCHPIGDEADREARLQVRFVVAGSDLASVLQFERAERGHRGRIVELPVETVRVRVGWSDARLERDTAQRAPEGAAVEARR